MIEPVGFSASGSGLILAGLGTCQSVKNKHVNTVYSHNVSYKKPKKPVAGNVINLSTDLLSVENISSVGVKSGVSWGSEIGSVADSISNLSDVENMANTMAEETSYTESGEDDNINNAIQPSFESISNDDVALKLPFHVDIRFNQVLLLELCALRMQCFNSTKSFALDIELFAVLDKLIIRSFFTSEFSLNKAKVLAISNKILVNNDFRKVIIKKIPVNLFRSVMKSVFFKFGKIISIKMQLIRLWQKTIIEFKSSKVASLVAFKWLMFMRKDSVHVVLANEDKQAWVFRDQHWALLYTLSIGTMIHNFSVLVEAYDRCTVICFENRASKLTAIGSVSTSLSLACCAKYKQFGHVSDMCSVGENSGIHEKWVVTDQNWICLANIYKKKQTSIICLVFFVAGGSSFLLGSSSSLSTDPSPGAKFSIDAWSSSNSTNSYGVSNLIFDIVKKLSFVELVPLTPVFHELSLAVFTSLASEVNLDMVLDGVSEPSAPSFSAVVDDAFGFSLSSSKILTTKFSVNQIGLFVFWFWLPIIFFIPISGLYISSRNTVSFITKTKLRSSSRLWIKDKYDEVQIFTSGLDVGCLGAGIAVVMNNFLAHHVSKIILVWLLFKSKLLVSVLGLYVAVSAGIHFEQALEVNSIIAKTVNTSTFMVLGGDFNKCRSGRSASFKFCSSLDLVNLFNSHYLIKTPIWCNSRSAERTIDYIFVSKSLFSTVVKHWVGSVSDFFDIDHNAVVVLVSLSGLLDVQLNGLHKQVYKDCWKFKIKDADSTGWSYFRDCSSARILIIKIKFLVTAADHDLDAMWLLLEGALVGFADEIFFRLWFSDFQCSKNKQFSKFLGLELLVVKIVKKLESDNTFRFDCLVEKWSTLDTDKALVLRNMVHADQKMINILKYLSIVRKGYRKSKIYESKLVQNASIRAAIEKHMKKFCSDKGSMIRSVVLDHLVVNNELYVLLNYVRDNVFSGVMDIINMSELFVVKHDDESVIECLLVLLNECLFVGITARKIFFDRIFFACSKFGVLHSDNFSVLKGTSTQVLVFAVGSVDMYKAYDSVSWYHLKASLWHIKMCDRFIKFFGNIYKDKINRVMTNFGLSNGYRSEVFSPLLWRIFYDPLLCKIKRHEHLCKYWINTKFVAKLGRVKSNSGMSFFFAAEAFVNNTVTSWSNKLMDSKGEQDCRVMEIIKEEFNFKEQIE
ncbi:hypothetical protein G9A89_005461 [Geosiphon pyriformis]|nr:hypothetical protein G9A89_005461 [Geosiphon pyriformis]